MAVDAAVLPNFISSPSLSQDTVAPVTTAPITVVPGTAGTPDLATPVTLAPSIVAAVSPPLLLLEEKYLRAFHLVDHCLCG